MSLTIELDANCLNHLDLTPVESILKQQAQAGNLVNSGQPLHFEIHYPQTPEDPRELSEIPEIRLWFLRLDARYPWLPLLLDWEAGDLARYAAMLVPHQFSRTEGIQYNPEALEIFVMQKVFASGDWLRQQGETGNAPTRLKFMAQMLGYELEDDLFDLLL